MSPPSRDQPSRPAQAREAREVGTPKEGDPDPESRALDSGAGAESSFPSLLPPPRGARRLRLVLLVTLSLICLITAGGLYPAASYALSSDSPRSLGKLATANLEKATQSGTQWVSAIGKVSESGVAFGRKGATSGFVLTRLEERKDVWLLLPTFGRATDYVPPRSFSGRLLRRDQLGLALNPVARLIDQESGKGTDYLLIEGAVPKSYRTELVAFFLLAMTGLLSLLRFAYLTRKPRLEAGAPVGFNVGTA